MTTEELMAEVERLRNVLKRIEALVWYEPQDDDDTVEAVRAMVRERDDARRAQNQLAEDVDALAREAERARAERDRARADLARCREVQAATAEGWRHEVAEVAAIVGAPAHTAELAACVRAEVERLKAERDELEGELAWARAALDAARHLRRQVRERDEARAEVERLRAEVERLRNADPGPSSSG